MKNMIFSKIYIRTLFVLVVSSQDSWALERTNFQETKNTENNSSIAITDHTFSSFNYSVFVNHGYSNPTHIMPVKPKEAEGVGEVDHFASNNAKLYTRRQNSVTFKIFHCLLSG
tara:strand:- start:12078 stop:12419 length:342 start_codon:yes stop_codon:yes gene_type:complete